MKQISMVWLFIFALSLSSCRAQPTPADNEAHPELKNIPVYPESSAWMEGIPGTNQLPEDYQTYSYIADVFKIETLAKFYEENMPSNEWELFSTTENDMGRESITLLFSKAETIAQIEIIEWTATSYLVSVNFYNDP